MQNKTKTNKLIREFLRYAVVGGIAFLFDAGALAFCREIIFKGSGSEAVMAISVAAGFIVGLVVNYILSILVVFKTAEQQKKGKTVKAFLIFAVIGLIGLGLTELGMYLGVKIVGSTGLWYLLVKCFVAGAVLVWNYIGRKIFVFKGA
jgi:putative flippase GtrA